MKIKLDKVKIPEKETHYRYRDVHMENGLHVMLYKYYSVYETNCFHYVVNEYDFNQMKRWNIPYLVDVGKEINVRKVGKNATRSYCHESKVLALNAFEKRKAMQLFHAETAMSKAKISLRKICTMNPDEIGDSLNCGLDDHLASFIFD